MNKLQFKFIFLILAISMSFNIFSQNIESSNNEQSIEWQKVNLEEKLKLKIDTILSKALPTEDFVTFVKISIFKEKSFSKTNKSNISDLNNNSAEITLRKFDLDIPDFDSLMKNKELQNSIFSRIKNVEVGVVIDKSINKKNLGFLKQIVRNSLSVINGKKPKLIFSSMDLKKIKNEKKKFKKDQLKKEADEKEKKQIEKDKKKLDEKINKEISRDLKIDELKEKNKSFFAQIKEFKIPIALILATIIGSFIFSGAVKKLTSVIHQFIEIYQSLQKAKEQEKKDALESEILEENMKDVDDEMIINHTLQTIELKNYSGISRFTNLFEAQPQEAILMVKRLLASIDQKEVKYCMYLLLKAIPDEFLEKVFSQCNFHEKKLLYQALDSKLGEEQLIKGNDYLEKEVVKYYLVAPPSLDEETKKLLSEITLDQAINCIKENDHVAIILMNILPTGFINKILKELNEDQQKKYFSLSISYNEDHLNKYSSELKDLLISNKDKTVSSGSSPIIENIDNIISHIGIMSEHIITNSLIENKNFELLKNLSKKHFPITLIEKFSLDDFLVMNNKIPMSRKIRFLCSIDDETKFNYLLDRIAKKDTKARELIENEIKIFKGNKAQLEIIMNSKDKIYSDYMDLLRKIIYKNEGLKQKADKIVQEWLMSLEEQSLDDSFKSDINDDNIKKDFENTKEETLPDIQSLDDYKEKELENNGINSVSEMDFEDNEDDKAA